MEMSNEYARRVTKRQWKLIDNITDESFNTDAANEYYTDKDKLKLERAKALLIEVFFTTGTKQAGIS